MEAEVALPKEVIAVIQTAIIKAIMIAYSTAVGPLSSRKKFAILRFIDWFMRMELVEEFQFKFKHFCTCSCYSLNRG